MIEVDVDFNSVGRGGMVYAFPTAASSPVSAGTKVLAIDAAEGMRFVAIVDELAEDGTIWLDVQWEVAPPNFNFADMPEPAKAPTQDDLVADAGPGDFHLAYLAS